MIADIDCNDSVCLNAYLFIKKSYSSSSPSVTTQILWFYQIYDWHALKFLSRRECVSLSSRISKIFCVPQDILKIHNLPRPIGKLGFWTELMRHLPGTKTVIESLRLCINWIICKIAIQKTLIEWDKPFSITYFGNSWYYWNMF